MSKILVYTFWNPHHLTYKLARQLAEQRVFYLGKLSGLLNLAEQENFTHILGLGDYRKDAKKVRVESIFANKYGKQKLAEDGPDRYTTSWQLHLWPECYLGEHASNGPCNRSAYLLSLLVDQKQLSTKLAFGHFPSSYPLDQAVLLVDGWLKSPD